MKTLLTITLAILLSTLDSQAQISLEKIYNYSLTSTKINQTEYKFYLMDVTGSQCRIFNTDYTLWKTIPVSLPSNYYLYDIKFVTQNLFNTDASIELWYSAYQWVSTGTSTGYYKYVSKIINESGSVLADITGGAYAYVIKTGTEIYKLAVYAYDNSVTPGTIQTFIYSLPNPSSAADFVTAILADPYPNPASDFINLPLPEGSADRILQVISVTGQMVFEKETAGEPVFRLTTRGWDPGVYTYRILQDGIPHYVNKFVLH